MSFRVSRGGYRLVSDARIGSAKKVCISPLVLNADVVLCPVQALRLVPYSRLGQFRRVTSRNTWPAARR